MAYPIAPIGRNHTPFKVPRNVPGMSILVQNTPYKPAIAPFNAAGMSYNAGTGAKPQYIFTMDNPLYAGIAGMEIKQYSTVSPATYIGKIHMMGYVGTAMVNGTIAVNDILMVSSTNPWLIKSTTSTNFVSKFIAAGVNASGQGRIPVFAMAGPL